MAPHAQLPERLHGAAIEKAIRLADPRFMEGHA
jgi:hypothetical protein